MKVTVCIRSSGERTLPIVARMLAPQGFTPIVITEAPFARAVRKTFEIGLESQCDLLIACDADVIPSSHAIKFLVDLAAKEKPRNFMLQGKICDKFWGGPRPGGVRAFRGALLSKALNAIPAEGSGVNRPEAATVLNMKRQGYPFIQSDEVLAVHDFEQYYRDIFRKVLGQIRKHSRYLELLQGYWRREAATDNDFAVAAWCYGKARNSELGANVLDARSFSSFDAGACLRELGLVEKRPLDGNSLSPDFPKSFVASHSPPDEYWRCAKLMNQKPSLAARLAGASANLFRRVLAASPKPTAGSSI